MDNLNFLKFQSETDYEEFVKYLKTKIKYQSEKDIERQKAIINSKKEVIGLAMKDVRQIAKMISKSNFTGFLELMNGESYEECLIKGIVISSIKDYNLQIELMDKWIREIDSWALCDSVVSSMKWLKKSEIRENYFDYFYNLCYEAEEFVSRFGIVVLMVYYLEDEYIDKIYDMCLKVKNEQYYVQMAVAWLISMGFVKFKEKTYTLFGKFELSKFVQNKSISKCRESFRVDGKDKENLLKFKII